MNYVVIMNMKQKKSRAFTIAAVTALGIWGVAVAGTVTVDDLIGNDEITVEQAKACASNWAKDSSNLQGALLGGDARVARMVKASASPSAPNAFHVVQLEGGGFVVVSADSRIEPVIAFSESDDLIEDEDNPLFALLRKDIPARIDHVTALMSGSSNAANGGGAARLKSSPASLPEEILNAKRAWARLLSDDKQDPSGVKRLSAGEGTSKAPSDTRIKPLLKSTWNQSEVGNKKVYNYYTPNNYVCGCVATAMGQIMRYHKYPTASLPKYNLFYRVNGRPIDTAKEFSGKFDWNSMPLQPTKSITDAQCKAISKLTYFVGAASYMDYTAKGSGTWVGYATDALVNYFGWASAYTYEGGDAVNSIENAILANLDNSKPVALGIFEYAYGDLKNGHCIVVDGYGYNGTTLYTHLNLGWGGKNDAWYQLPNVSAGGYDWNILYQISYNLFPKENGEIISGRIRDGENGNKLMAAASVVAYDATGKAVASGKSGAGGIYSLIVPSAKDRYSPVTYSVQVQSGKKSGARSVIVGKSSNYSIGNRWGQDITCSTGLTITFHANDGTGSTKTQTFWKNEAQALSRNEFVRKGYTFKGWAASSTGPVKWENGQIVTISSDTQVYAVWEGLPPCVVTFNANDGTDNTRTQNFVSDVKQALLANPFTRLGYEFTGWATKANGYAVYSDGQEVAFTSDKTLYAVWQLDTRVQLTIEGDVLTRVELNGALHVLIPVGVRKIGREAFKDCGDLEGVAIPGSVVEIGKQTFSGCANLRHLSLPQSLKKIGESAFEGCSALAELTIPDSVEEIDVSAFKDCFGLLRVTIGRGVKTIHSSAFDNCQHLQEVHVSDLEAWCRIQFYGYNSNPLAYAHKLYINGELLTELDFPSGISKVGLYAFNDCESLVAVRIPEGVIEIDSMAFSGCHNLASISLPESLRRIGILAFQHCWALSDIQIPSGVTEINWMAFINCSGLKSVTIPSGVTNIEHQAFLNCQSLKRVFLSEGVKNIDYEAFAGCSSLLNVKIPNSVTNIERGAFMSCNNLMSAEIPAGRIGEDAFAWCEDLRDVWLGNDVTEVGGGAFGECKSLFSIDISSGNKNFVSEGGSLYNKQKTTLVCCAGGTDVLTLPAGVKDIGPKAFRGCHSLSEIYVEEGSVAYSVKDGALVDAAGTTLLRYPGSATSVTIPQGVSCIGDFAFSGCRLIKALTLPETVDEIGFGAFEDCVGLEEVKILNPNVTFKVDEDDPYSVFAFEGCDAIKNVTASSNICSENESLETFAFVNGTMMIDDGMFDGCVNLTKVSIPKSVDGIGFEPFIGCVRLKSISVAKGNPSVKKVNGLLLSVENDCLYAAERTVKSVKVPNGVPDLCSGVFAGCDSMTSITIPASVDSVDATAFRYERVYWEYDADGEEVEQVQYFGCKNLKTLKVAAGNESYKSVNNLLLSKDGTELVFVPDGLASITIPASVEVISDGAFPRNAKLNSISVAKGSSAFKSVNGMLLSKDGTELICVPCGLTDVTVPESVDYIYFDAFAGCTKLQRVALPSGLKSFDEDMFIGCSSLKIVSMPDTLKENCSMIDVAKAATAGVSYYTDKPPVTVIFNANGGMLQEATRAVPKGTMIGELPEPERTGYTFLGWFTAKTKGKKISPSTKVSANVTYFAQWKAQSYTVGITVSGKGTVTGAGKHVYGSQVKLSAKPAKGYVFVCWENDDLMSYWPKYLAQNRQVSVSFKMPAESVSLRAVFEKASEDLAPTISVDTPIWHVQDGGIVLMEVNSLSYAKVTASGLPPGIELKSLGLGDSSWCIMVGNKSKLKPGVYTTTVRATNRAGRKTAVKIKIYCPNVTTAVAKGLVNVETSTTNPYVLQCGQKFKWTDLGIVTSDNAKIYSVTGLPIGLKWDSVKKRVTGMPSKAGLYTVTLVVKSGKASYKATATFEVVPLPAAAIGTFNGYTLVEGNVGAASRNVKITLGSNGKISATIGSLKFSAVGWDVVDDKRCSVSITATRKVGKGKNVKTYRDELEVAVDTFMEWPECSLSGTVATYYNDDIVNADYDLIASKNVFAANADAKAVAVMVSQSGKRGLWQYSLQPTDGAEEYTYGLVCAECVAGGVPTLSATAKANGTVVLSGSIARKKVSSSSILEVSEDGQSATARFFTSGFVVEIVYALDENGVIETFGRVW